MKEDNTKIQETEKQICDTEESMDALAGKIHHKERELEEMKENGKHAHKYEALFERDVKIQAYIDAFPADHEEVIKKSGLLLLLFLK